MANEELRLVKAPDLDTDEVQGELVLTRLNTSRSVILNAAGLALWRGLDLVGTRSGANEMVQEAFPDKDPGAVEKEVNRLIDDLIQRGFLSETTV